ncbi:MAG: ABC transporter ATP-binding protein [Acidobacteria bacterium]|nr:ABC transporter ATP-binding protein [Acidobacteriota bacterium]
MRDYPLLRLLPYLKKYHARIFWGVVMVLGTNVFALVSPWILKETIDMFRHPFNRSMLLTYAALIIAAALAEGTFRYAMRRILIGVSRDVEYDLRNDLFAHLQLLPASFYQKHATGDIMSRATNDLSAVRTVLGPGIMYSINTIAISIMATVLLFKISISLTLLAFLPLIVVSCAVKKFGAIVHTKFERIQEQLSRISTQVQESLSGIRVVRAYNGEQAFIRQFDEANQEYFRRNLSLIRTSALLHPFNALFMGTSSVLLLWYGGRQVIQDRITLGEFVAFISYLAMLIWPTIALGWVVNIFQRGAASMGRINQLLDAPPEISDHSIRSPVSIHGRIEVRELNFSYNGIPVLHDISFSVSPGSRVAIVGRTGSGKTTLVQLLGRLYPVPDGAILIDGVDINKIPLKQLRKCIGFVPQDTFLFSESIRDNIAFGDIDGSAQRVQEAARVAGLEQDIETFPHRYDTLVGERGITLSGGQKQRTTIARALFVQPRILVLDDSLSSVDTYTEEKILTRLADAARGCTTLLVSHRISTVQNSDQILVLDQGRILERGTHQELLRRGGIYADMFEKQLLQEELDVDQ